jgi:hypothetical protein
VIDSRSQKCALTHELLSSYGFSGRSGKVTKLNDASQNGGAAKAALEALVQTFMQRKKFFHVPLKVFKTFYDSNVPAELRFDGSSKAFNVVLSNLGLVKTRKVLLDVAFPSDIHAKVAFHTWQEVVARMRFWVAGDNNGDTMQQCPDFLHGEPLDKMYSIKIGQGMACKFSSMPRSPGSSDVIAVSLRASTRDSGMPRRPRRLPRRLRRPRRRLPRRPRRRLPRRPRRLPRRLRRPRRRLPRVPRGRRRLRRWLPRVPRRRNAACGNVLSLWEVDAAKRSVGSGRGKWTVVLIVMWNATPVRYSSYGTVQCSYRTVELE